MHGICLVCFIDCCFLFLDLLWCLLITRHLNSAYLWILLLCHVVPLQLWTHVHICLVLLFVGFLIVVKPPRTQETIHYMFGSSTHWRTRLANCRWTTKRSQTPEPLRSVVHTLLYNIPAWYLLSPIYLDCSDPSPLCVDYSSTLSSLVKREGQTHLKIVHYTLFPTLELFGIGIHFSVLSHIYIYIYIHMASCIASIS